MPNMGSVHVLLEHSNRGKKSIGIDVSTEQGLDLIYRLAATSDVFLTNKLPSVRKKLRIELEDIKKHNPNIIYVAGTGGGERGPEADRGGYDFLSYWCRAGSAMGTTPTDVDYLAGQPGPGLRRLDRGMTIAGGIIGRALPPRAHRRGAVPRRVAARCRHVVHEPGRRALAPAEHAVASRPEPRRRHGAGQPAGRHVSDRRRAIPRVLVPAGLQVLALGLPIGGSRGPHHGRALQLARAAGGQRGRRLARSSRRSSPRPRWASGRSAWIRSRASGPSRRTASS